MKAEEKQAELKQKTERDIKDKEQEIAKLTNSANDFIREQKAEQAKKNKVLEQQKKTLESKEKVELTEIKQKYEAELAKAQNQEQEIKAKNEALSDYIRLINQQENKIETLKLEWEILHSKKAELTAKNYLLDNEVEKEKRQRGNDKLTHEGEIRILNNDLKRWEQ